MLKEGMEKCSEVKNFLHRSELRSKFKCPALYSCLLVPFQKSDAHFWARQVPVLTLAQTPHPTIKTQKKTPHKKKTQQKTNKKKKKARQ